MSAAVLTSDVLISSPLMALASARGWSLATLSTVEQLAERLAEVDLRLVLIDLNLPGLEVSRVISLVREGPGSSTVVVAFGPHVHVAKLKAAAAAGCDRVLARGQFIRQMEQIVASYLA